MFHIVLFEPEIPPNTGNIIRLCANTGCQLHLIKPYGFRLNDKTLKRAGLDYHALTILHEHKDFETFIETIKPKQLFAIETCGTQNYDEIQYKDGDAFLFGSETKGLPTDMLDKMKTVLKIPMNKECRSINLSNSVAIVIYEAWRQLRFQ